MLRGCLKRLGWMLCLLLWLPVAAGNDSVVTGDEAESGFVVHSAKTRLANGEVRLDAVFGLRFSEKLFDALHNGISLNLSIDVRVFRQRSYLWDARVAAAQQRYRISYSPLTKTYTLNNLNKDIQYRFPDFETLLTVISVLSDFPLMSAEDLVPEAQYRGEIRIAVNRDSLPVPLRLMSYVTSGWHFVSEWYTWSLDQ